MSHARLRWLSVSLCLVGLLAGATLTAHQARAAGRPAQTVVTLSHSALGSRATCQVLEVTLHGTAAATQRCRDGQSGEAKALPGRAGISPLAFESGACWDDALVLYWNGPFGSYAWAHGPTLCINGQGLLNLNQVFSDGLNWNDQASAWWTGCYNDFFYVDINQGGGSAFAYGSVDGESSPYGNFPYENVGNDQLSSIYQSASWSGDNCYF